jgi:hypothetical protein
MTHPTLKHTPGPWNVIYKHKYNEWHVSVPTSTGSMKWALFDDGIRSENPEADARLISAAPDLLEALRKIVHDWDGEPEDMADARAAIKKATEATA